VTTIREPEPVAAEGGEPINAQPGSRGSAELTATASGKWSVVSADELERRVATNHLASLLAELLFEHELARVQAKVTNKGEEARG
jgi:hypothetical protein